MNKKQKQHFIRELTHNVMRDVLGAVPRMPDDWGGHELRAYIADKFKESVMTVGREGPYGRAYARQTRAYRAAVLERGL